jgi:hypothetical protein
MNMESQLRKIAKYLKAGIIDRELIEAAIRYSIQKSQETPGTYNPESLTVSRYMDTERYPKLHLICREISKQLGILMASKSSGDDIKKHGDELELRIDLWADEVKSIDIIAHVNKLFAECKGSHADKGKAMKRKLTEELWEAYKKARTGRPITQTIEQYFTQRSKEARKSAAKPK